MMRKITYNLFALMLLLLCNSVVQAQTNPLFYEYSYNQLDWYHIESDHFNIIFQEGNSRSAQVIARIAEEIYPAITDLYEYEPDSKVSIVLKDREDYSNGAAYFFDNKIDIWLPALDTPLRGTHNWLRNVIAHEFTHIVQIQASLKRSRKLPAVYLQWLDYERVRRPDVLYGFPNGIITMPFAAVNVPAWFAEGTAQFQRTGLYYDTWDSHRDMILRTRILNDTYFSLAEMATFASKSSIERETVYNQGYAFTNYLANKYGEKVLKEISNALGKQGVNSVEKAIQIATGTPGREVFDNWISELKMSYGDATQSIKSTPSTYIEKDGFFNFYPRVSPDGKYIAYLSNRGTDISAQSLYLKTVDGTEFISLLKEEDDMVMDNHMHQLEKPSVKLASSYSFSPDGSKIAYVTIRKNRYGEQLNDLYIYSIEDKKKERITSSSRFSSPVWSTDGESIYGIQYQKGTQNLVRFDLDNKNFETLTKFQNGETLFSPTLDPSGNNLYFAYADKEDRNLQVLNIQSQKVDLVLNSRLADIRDPFVSSDGRYLYYSTDADGIFNIHRWEIGTNEFEQLTSVIGGAFMPFVMGDELLYSEYEADGYKVKKASLNELGNTQGYYELDVLFDYEAATVSDEVFNLNTFDDSDFEALPVQILAIADTGRVSLPLSTREGIQDTKVSRYNDVFTSFSILPAVRFDNYSAINGRNGDLLKNGQIGDLGNNLVRDFKTGFYFSSRDVTDRLSLFGGMLLGVGSEPSSGVGDFFSPERITSLDRDIFLIAEHRGLPFIKSSWSPTVAIEIYNLHRNVRDGLTIEEFPCTSCLPENSSADLAYEIWEADLFLRSKINRASILELGIGYSPYRVNTDDFFSRELNQFVPGSTSEYFRSTTLSASYNFNFYKFSRERDIAPIGIKGYLRYQYQPSRLLDEFDIEDGQLVPIYQKFKNHSLEYHARYGKKFVDKHVFQVHSRAFTYLQNPSEFFFLDYIGGFIGMRSYPFFAIGGNRTAWGSLSYFAPILTNMNKQVGPYTFDKVYARLFFEAGNGWSGPLEIGDNLKTGIGAELRFSLAGYYLFPLKFFVSGSYGFNRFDVTLPNDFITDSQSNRVNYGRELLFHFGLTFDFELLQ